MIPNFCMLICHLSRNSLRKVSISTSFTTYTVRSRPLRVIFYCHPVVTSGGITVRAVDGDTNEIIPTATVSCDSRSGSNPSTFTGVSLGTLFRDDKWHHAAVVYDESNRRMSGYIDGNEMVHIDFPEGRSFAPRTKIETAREYVVADDAVRKGFYGLVDEVRLVRRALSPSEFISFKRPPSGLMLLVK